MPMPMPMRTTTAALLAALVASPVAGTTLPVCHASEETLRECFLSGIHLAQGEAPGVRLTLQRLVDPETRVSIQGRLVRPALHALVRFDTLRDVFEHIDREAGRWTFDSPAARQSFAERLMRRGVESRIVSMDTELPLEILQTHTRDDIARAVNALGRRPASSTPASAAGASIVFAGRHWQLTTQAYLDALVRVRERWATSLNCWSASSSIPGRVLSNWYVIDEGITLYGATYDSTEHFWQAVKYHPDVTIEHLSALLGELLARDWTPWLAALGNDQDFYLANAYAVEFLKANLARERLEGFRTALARVATPGERARAAQQRGDRAPGTTPRFASLDEKVLWGDLADVLHLVVVFGGQPISRGTPWIADVRAVLIAKHFDAIHLDGYAGGRFGFLSPEFQALMLEIWKVKFLRIPRLRDVIRSTSGVRLDHFLDDSDSPDIPIPIYVGYLHRIREMALEVQP